MVRRLRSMWMWVLPLMIYWWSFPQEIYGQFTVVDHTRPAQTSTEDTDSPMITVTVDETKYQVINHCSANRQELIYNPPPSQQRQMITVPEVRNNPFSQGVYWQDSRQGTMIPTINAIDAGGSSMRYQGLTRMEPITTNVPRAGMFGGTRTYSQVHTLSSRSYTDTRHLTRFGGAPCFT